jgi:pimeloyl-ACP methyl ester carboxylesterase
VHPIVLVPGWWLGAWAWDDVAARLRAEGHDVTPLTLPGLESVDADRSTITLDDHVRAISEAVAAAEQPVVLAVHSGAAVPGYVASDRLPERIAAMVYVDSLPAAGPLMTGVEGPEKPLPEWGDLGENLDGISDAQLATFRERAVPQPAGPIRESAELSNEARLGVPSTVICTAFPSDQIQAAVEDEAEWVADLADLRDVTYIDLPTSHWPMFSRPRELAWVIGELASAG